MNLYFRVMLLAVAALIGQLGRGAEFHVSPSGDDANAGTRQRPFATLARARDAARDTRNEPTTIYLHGGTYYLREPLIFTAPDSRTSAAALVFTSMPKQRAVVSGGQRLELSWKSLPGGIFRARVPAGFTSDQLFVNGQRQPMARYPNYDPDAQYFQGFSADCTSPQRVLSWSNPAGGYLHAMHRALWGDMHWQIAGKTADGQLKMIGGWQNNRQMGAHAKYRFVENIFEELDAPGEWFLDRKENVLYFYPPPGVDLASADVEAVRLAHLIEFRGTERQPIRNITLKNLVFAHASRTFMGNKEPLLRSDWTTYRGGAIVFTGTEYCSLRDCTIDQVGGNGVFVNKYNRHVEITGCHLADAGASAISFVGDPRALRSPLFEYHQTQTLDQMDKTPGPQSSDYPADCLVEDCLIYRNGRVEKQTAGVNLCMAESITVRHCSIYDCPRAGINICDGSFGGHVIEYNDVFDTVKETGDHGSFNSWGRDRYWHPDRSLTARWVEQFPDMPTWDCRKTNVIRNNRWRCDHGWDIDLDDGSSNYEIYNNLCLAGGIKLREGYFRRVYNNVIVNNTFCPHVWYPNCHTSFTHNIVWEDRYRPARMKTTDQGAQIDNNFVHQVDKATGPATGLQQFGGDRHSLVGDALFIDPAAGDYRVRDESPARALGFENFPMDQFGVRKPELKRQARSPRLPDPTASAGAKRPDERRKKGSNKPVSWLGATVRAVRGDGEMSALGLADSSGVLLVRVPPTSPAFRAGLRESDVIRTINGQIVAGPKMLSRACRDGQKSKVVLGVWRNQAATKLELNVSR